MTEQGPEQGMDPRATFRLDQEAAENEATTRDRAQWEFHLASQAVQIDAARAHVRIQEAKASLLASLAILADLFLTGVVVVGLILGVVSLGDLTGWW